MPEGRPRLLFVREEISFLADGSLPLRGLFFFAVNMTTRNVAAHSLTCWLTYSLISLCACTSFHKRSICAIALNP